MPLVRSFWLSKKKGKETWIEPRVDHSVTPPIISFSIKIGKGEPQSGTVNRQGAVCIACGMPVSFDHIRSEGKAGRMYTQLMAIVAEGTYGRVYLASNAEQTAIAAQSKPEWKPEADLPHNPRDFKTPNYGMNTFADLFTSRQLVALNTFSNLVYEAREQILKDADVKELNNDNTSLSQGSVMTVAYADAVATYLGMNVSRLANRSATICFWDTVGEKIQQVFARQAIPMTWDYTEGNPFSDSTGNFVGQLQYMANVIELSPCNTKGRAEQRDATTSINGINNPLISTDPPYYDNIAYADLSDFFYIWLRQSLSKIYPDLFSTLLVPKAQELIATSYRFGGDKRKAEQFFEKGLRKAFESMRAIQHADYPLTVYYAFKQSESDIDEAEIGDLRHGSTTVASTGWETMLEGLIKARFTITGTWPMRTELIGNLKKNMAALASSIVIVCRPRPVDSPIASRKVFLNALRSELPAALKNLQHGNIAPVDLAQASIGPGMAIYSRYSKVVESDGTPLKVRTALQLINRTLDEVLAEQEGEYDAETCWAIAWFEQFEMKEGPFGVAETLSKAKNISISSLKDAGFLEAKGGKVRLLRREELTGDWNPKTAARLTVWEIMQRMIHALDKKGETEAATILRWAGERGEIARDLAYRLYTVCERKGWTQEALAYNSLVISWSEIGRLTRREPSEIVQGTFL